MPTDKETANDSLRGNYEIAKAKYDVCFDAYFNANPDDPITKERLKSVSDAAYTEFNKATKRLRI